MRRFNDANIDQTILYAKKNCGGFIRSVLERHGWSYPGNKESKLIKPIHPNSVKKL